VTLSGLLLAAAIVAVPAPPAAAQEDQPLPVRAAEAIAASGYYQSPSAEVDRDALAAIASAHDGFGFVVLSGEPVDESIEFADDVLDAARGRAPLVHTVVVVSPTDYGAVSTRYSDDAIDAAFEDVVDTLRTDRVAGLAAFADRVPSAGPTLADETDDDGSSFPVGWVLLLVALVGGSFLLKAFGLGSSGDGYADGEGYEDGDGGGSSSRRRSWSSRRSFSSRRSSSSSSSRRSSSSRSSSRRGRGGGRF